MTQLTRTALLLGIAGTLAAQGTLSFGEITAVTPATTPPTYVVNVILTTSGTAAGAQFDLNYDPTQLNVVVGLGPSATAASEQLSTVMLTASLSNPFCATTPCVQPQNNGPGQRVIITGCCSANQTSGTASVTANVMGDGSIATLTVQATATATTTGQKLTILPGYLGATTAGGQNVPAKAITLTLGAGSSDHGSTGILNLYPTYLVGGVYPSTSDSAPNFGSGSLTLNDLILELFAVNNVPGYAPACGSDRFDAMDTYPLDTATARGGAQNGTLNLNDLIVELFRVNKLPGYLTLPVRISAPYTCSSSVNPGTAGVTRQARTITQRETEATLVVGAAESTGSGQERVPVYVRGGRNLARVGVTFGLGDQQSQLRFQAASVAPSLVQDSQLGIVAAAWLQGLDVTAGQQFLLGYVTGPSGFAANLKVFGASASGLDDFREVGLDVSGASVARQ